MAADNGKIAELTELIGEIRARVRERHPAPGATPLRLPDLMPILHARDAALGKAAAIGTVNPRGPGLLNSIAQSGKRFVARVLNWLVRDQIDYNLAVVSALEAVVAALEENNRALRDLANEIPKTEAKLGPLIEPAARDLGDLRAHWVAWRGEWERKLAANEMQFVRGLADLQGAFSHRATLMESNFREITSAQHRDFEGALDRSGLDIQKRLWADLERIRQQYETVIHAELRTVRQRAALLAPASPPASAAPGESPRVEIDWLKFAEKFRGSEEYVQRGQRFYVDRFRGRTNVLDLGCGRGEFLELMREAGVEARGIDQSDELVALCRRKGLRADVADLFAHLESLPEQSLDGVFCSQVVEHLPPHAVPALIRLAHAKLAPGGLLAVETPNPECLAIFATHFYLDPTHTRPVPPALLAFYFEEHGFGLLETHRFAPASESIAAVAEMSESTRQAFFGAMDYCVLGTRL